MIYKFKDILFIILIIGVVGIAMNILFGNNTMIYLTKEQIKGTALTWYKIDGLAYINGIRNSVTNTTELALEVPTREWLRNPQNLDEFWSQLINNMAVILDYIIMIVNILLYPLKVGGYVERFVLSLLGLNYASTTSSIKWLGDMANGLISLSIPYV